MREGFLGLVALSALSCSSADGPGAPDLTSGRVDVFVATTGSDAPTGYMVVLDEAPPRSIGANGTTSFAPVGAGDHVVALTNVPPNCSPSGPNPRSVGVIDGQATETTFAVTCGAARGSVEVSTSTAGSDVDTDGYTVHLESTGASPAETAEAVEIGPNDVVRLAGLPTGDYAVRLTEVAPNCGVRGDNPAAVTVTAGAATLETFVIDCYADAGALELTTVTSGDELDPDGYVVLLDEDHVHPIGSNDVRRIGGLTAGPHLVRLTDVADNCVVLDESPEVSVAVSTHQTTELTVTLECGQSSNASPTVTISSPDTTSTEVPLTVAPGTVVTFSGRASDPEDGPVPPESLVWVSNLDGALATGDRFSTGSLSEGQHTVTLTAADSDGGEGTETVLVVVVSSPQPAYQIKLRLAADLVLTPGQRTVIEASIQKLESVVVGDLPDIRLVSSGFSCGARIPPVDETVDDLLLYLAIEPIDGPGGILGAASACIQRDGSRLPALGGMLFDAADLAGLEAAEQLDELLLHEAMHVMGFGTIWDHVGLLKNPSAPGRGGTPGDDAYFDGPSAIEQFLVIGGEAYADGNIVPVENDTLRFGTGSLDSHWRESVLGHELMTPALNPAVPVNPLSVVTIGQFRDLGYAVDFAAADPYSRDFAPHPELAAAGRVLRLEDDILRGPLWLVDPDGEMRRIR